MHEINYIQILFQEHKTEQILPWFPSPPLFSISFVINLISKRINRDLLLPLAMLPLTPNSQWGKADVSPSSWLTLQKGYIFTDYAGTSHRQWQNWHSHMCTGHSTSDWNHQCFYWTHLIWMSNPYSSHFFPYLYLPSSLSSLSCYR